jgi:hypothetical protein
MQGRRVTNLGAHLLKLRCTHIHPSQQPPPDSLLYKRYSPPTPAVSASNSHRTAPQRFTQSHTDTLVQSSSRCHSASTFQATRDSAAHYSSPVFNQGPKRKRPFESPPIHARPVLRHHPPTTTAPPLVVHYVFDGRCALLQLCAIPHSLATHPKHV